MIKCFWESPKSANFRELVLLLILGEDFILEDDVIKIKEILDLNFNILGMKVIDEKNNNLGKVADFTFSLVNFLRFNGSSSKDRF